MAKIAIHRFFELRAVVSKLSGSSDFNIPPYIHMRRTGGTTVRHYYESGLKSYMPIATMALQKRINLDGPVKILDFGCGVARQLLHFIRDYPSPNYYACDVNSKVIDFIKNKYPQVESYCNKFYPPSVYPADFFDMVYSVSIFSHLNTDGQKKWLAELSRILKPGAYCFITTQGFKSLSKMMVEASSTWPGDSPKLLREKGYLYREYGDFELEKAQENILKLGSKYLGITDSYGEMIISPEYIIRNWTIDGLEVAGVVEGVIDCVQDLVILKKAADPGKSHSVSGGE